MYVEKGEGFGEVRQTKGGRHRSTPTLYICCSCPVDTAHSLIVIVIKSASGIKLIHNGANERGMWDI